MVMLLNTIILSSFVVILLITAGFFVALREKNNSIADMCWGLGAIAIAFTSLFVNGFGSPRPFVVTSLVLAWGLRLTLHIYLRNKGKKEDFRYAQWRKKWGASWVLKSYVYVFLLQGALMLLLTLPVTFTNTYLGPTHGILDRIGVLVWIIGFFFESVSDWQLMSFKRHASNKGKIMTQGLWKYSRHPNYFGEALMWWGIYIIALSNPSAWWTAIGPLFITFSLLKVSGVTLLERKYKGNAEYQNYQKNTSTFIPWFPKNA